MTSRYQKKPKEKTIFTVSKEIHAYLQRIYWEWCRTEDVTLWFYTMIKLHANSNGRIEKDSLFSASEAYVNYLFKTKETPKITKFQRKFKELYDEHTQTA